ncbi:MAG: uroporphyrinogen-III decarboxylase [Solibacillus sp.]|uniref:uroporphyrinogen-III decarboxylase n=1 Tax=Solibacillus sp. TaxID=1909654 RepID=UPI003315F76B
MEETKFAELDMNKLEAIKQLEQKLNVTLIAYELSPTHHAHHEDAPIVINPS